MFGIGVQELALILVIALLVFGPKRLPELARMLGRGMGEFRRASHDLRQSLALDEIQTDLRREMDAAAGSIHKAAQEPERPAQAGDDESASDENETLGAAEANADEPTASEGETSDADASDSGAREPHPGELPLGNDHEHHDATDDRPDAMTQNDRAKSTESRRD